MSETFAEPPLGSVCRQLVPELVDVRAVGWRDNGFERYLTPLVSIGVNT